MKKVLWIIYAIFIMMFCSCNLTENSDENDNVFDFIGTWEIINVKYLNDDNEENNIVNLIGEQILIGDNRICLLDEDKKYIHYKLKAVREDYRLSYESNLTIKEFMNNRESVDLISVIEGNIIVADFFLNSNDEMIFIYDSIVFEMKRVSCEVEFKNNIEDNTEQLEGDKNDSKEGVMLGLKSPRKLLDDGSYTEEEYKTFWISHDNGEISTIYLKDNIIFPRMNGIWKLRAIGHNINNEYYDEFQVAINEEEYTSNIILNDLSVSEYKSIKFVCNDYVAIEKYVGNNFKGNYPIYQIIPINNINIENGMQIDEVFNAEVQEKYLNDYNLEIASMSEMIKEKFDLEYIDYSNISIERSRGKWVLVSNIRPKDMSESGYEFKLSFLPDKRLVKYNSMYIPWRNLKGELGFFKDAFISPLGKIAIVQFSNYISIYKIENKVLITEPLITIPIDEDDEIIMAEWAVDWYVDRWVEVFKDGQIIN